MDVLPEHDAHRRKMVDELNRQGFRVIALAYKEMPGAPDEPVYSVKDESDLILLASSPSSTRPRTPRAGLAAAAQPERGRQDPDRRQRNHHRLHLSGSGPAGGANLTRSQVEAMSETELAEAAGATVSLPGWPRPTRSASSALCRAKVT